MVPFWTRFPACFAHPDFAHSVSLLKRSAPEEFQSSSRADPEQIQRRSRGAPEQLQRSSRAAPEQIQSRSRGAPEQELLDAKIARSLDRKTLETFVKIWRFGVERRSIFVSWVSKIGDSIAVHRSTLLWRPSDFGAKSAQSV